MLIDIAAVMKSKHDIEYKKGDMKKKREIMLMDESSSESCVLQLWNDDIEKVQYAADTVVIFRRLKVHLFTFSNDRFSFECLTHFTDIFIFVRFGISMGKTNCFSAKRVRSTEIC